MVTSQNKIIPEGWEEKEIGQIADIISGSTPSTNTPSFWNGKIVWVTPDDLSENEKIYLKTSERKISEKGLKYSSAKIIPKNSLVISSRAPIGYVAIMTVNYTTNQGCKSLKFKSILPEFAYYSITFNVNRLKHLGEGTTFLEISKTQLSRVKFCYPKSIKEQQEIAQILLATDKTIDNTKDLIEKDKKIKEGLMRDLFYDNSSSLPNNWKLNSAINELYMKGRIGWQGLKANEFLDFGNYYLVTGIHFSNYNLVDWSKCYRITKRRYEQDPFIQVKKDDVIITKDGTIGKVAFVDNIPGKACLNSHLLVLRPLKSNLLPKFLFYQLMSFRFLNFIENIKTGSTLTGLSQKNFGKFELLIPPIVEQKKIVSILESIDKKIELEEMFLSKLQKIKSGLMQDLLTGKVRVAYVKTN